MKTQHWIPVLVWCVLLVSGTDQAWAQAKCAAGAVYRVARPAERESPDTCSTKAASNRGAACLPLDCGSKAVAGGERKAMVACKQKTCVECEPACSTGQSPRFVSHPQSKGVAVAEPRKLALPCGPPKRLTASEATNPPYVRSLGKCAPCQSDCRRDTIFGTETIFGDLSARSFFGASLENVSECCSEKRGKDEKGTARSRAKSKCGCDRDSPILEGWPEEPEWNNNPFRDDSVEPAPLRSLPRIPADTSAARQTPAVQPPANLRVVRAKPVSSYSTPAVYEVERLRFDDWVPNPMSIFD